MCIRQWERDSEGQSGRQAAWCSRLYMLWLCMTCVSDEKTLGAADEASHYSTSTDVGMKLFSSASCPSLGHCTAPLMLSLDEPAWEVRDGGLSQGTMDECQALPCTSLLDNLTLLLKVVSNPSSHLAPPLSSTSADMLLIYRPARITSASCHRSFPLKNGLPVTVQAGMKILCRRQASAKLNSVN